MRHNKFATFILVLIAMALMMVACNSAENSMPEFESGATVDWDTALTILNTGEVEAVFQTHSLDVTMNLKDGRHVKTVEPGIDDIFDEIDACGDPCAQIAIATE